VNAPANITGRAHFPAKLRFLFQPKRFKVAHGGRGGAKSWSFARALLILANQRKLRILCCREIQNSIDESVHALLKEQIDALGLGYAYDVNKRSIRNINTGSEFIFAGLWMNVDSIKSKEGIDIVWVEEAHKVSDTSWRKLIPTIRKEGSEIWVSFNPELDTDPTYVRFITQRDLLGDRAEVVEINWRDNPWFPQVLLDDMHADRRGNYDDYLWTWEGKPRQFLEGSVYAEEIRRATLEGRIGRVPYVPGAAVNICMDLGWRDLMTAWFIQKPGLDYRAIHYWQGRRKKVSDFLEYVQETKYLVGTIFLPHDADNAALAANGESTKDRFEEGGANVVVLPRIPSEQYGIETVRSIFPMVYFDEEGCRDGLTSLRRYRYGIDERTKQYSRVPMHDEASHGAKGFEGFALSTVADYTEPVLNLQPVPKPDLTALGSLRWMNN
jgi:phage terminase large subunit